MNGETITIQSENRFAIVKVADGKTIMTSNYANANSMRLQLETLFLDEKTCRISVRDAGFGDFFPATEFH
jgi:hypothetical protein